MTAESIPRRSRRSCADITRRSTATCTRIGADLADELAAEVFAVAYERRSSFDESRGDVLPWLFGIATNLLRRHRRTEVRRLRAYARTGVDPLVMDVDDVHSRIDAMERGAQIAHALASLPAKQRDALLLHALADLPVAAVAVAMRVPEGTAKAWLARARASARKSLTVSTTAPALVGAAEESS